MRLKLTKGLGQEIAGFEWTTASSHRSCLPFASCQAVRNWVFRENPSRIFPPVHISVGADHLFHPLAHQLLSEYKVPDFADNCEFCICGNYFMQTA